MVMARVKRTRVVPMAAIMLGAAGLAPAIIAILARLSAGSEPDTPLPAFLMLMAFLNSTLILGFLGGIWWGVALSRIETERMGPLLGIAVAPTILALGIAALSGWLPKVGAILLGVVIVATLLVDRGLVARGLVPNWWMRLRVPLSSALGLLTILLGLLM
jgi:hypothetical protein